MLRWLAPPPRPTCLPHTLRGGTVATHGTDPPVCPHPVCPSLFGLFGQAHPYVHPHSLHCQVQRRGFQSKGRLENNYTTGSRAEIPALGRSSRLPRNALHPSSLETPHFAGAAQMMVKILSRVFLEAAARVGSLTAGVPFTPSTGQCRAPGRAVCTSVGGDPWPQSWATLTASTPAGCCLAPLAQVPPPPQGTASLSRSCPDCMSASLRGPKPSLPQCPHGLKRVVSRGGRNRGPLAGGLQPRKCLLSQLWRPSPKSKCRQGWLLQGLRLAAASSCGRACM